MKLKASVISLPWDQVGVQNHTSAFSASNTAPGTGSGQNSSGVKLQSIRFINGREIDEHT